MNIGIITHKTLLPITRLNFGRTQLSSSSGVHIRWADSNAVDKGPSTECQSRAQICGGLDTFLVDCTRWWDRQKSNLFTATLQNFPVIPVKFINECRQFLIYIHLLKN